MVEPFPHTWPYCLVVWRRFCSVIISSLPALLPPALHCCLAIPPRRSSSEAPPLTTAPAGDAAAPPARPLLLANNPESRSAFPDHRCRSPVCRPETTTGPRSMPPNTVPVADQTSILRRRPTGDRVVPAIPLAFSKPRPSKAQPKPKPEVNAKIEDEHVTNGEQYVAATPAGEPNGDGITEDSEGDRVNGDGGAAGHVVEEKLDESEPTGDVTYASNIDAADSDASTAMSLSNGATPELPANGSTRSTQPSTPPVEAQPSVTASPTSSRKPFDMRHIRTELPPAFVPSAEQHTPRSAASSQSNRPFLPHAHPSHPSTSSIVFGGQDSLSSSPAPPLSGGSGFAPPPFSGYTNAQQSFHYIPQGHAHHASEPYGPRSFNQGYQQSGSHFNSRPSQAHHVPAQYHHPHANTPFRYPPREVFTPIEPQMNGHISRDGSQASSVDQQPQNLMSPTGPDGMHDTVKGAAQVPKRSMSRPRYARPTVPVPPPDFNADIENAEALRQHILSQSAMPDFSDCVLEVTDGLSSEPVQLHAHRLIVSRSPTLASLMQVGQKSMSTSGPSRLEVRLQGRHASNAGLLRAVKYLYGGPVLQMDAPRPRSSASEQGLSNGDRMENALQTVAAGAYLKVFPLANRAMDVVNSLLHWDTISSALSFALEGGLSEIWTVEDGSEDPVSSSSSEDSRGKLEHHGIPTNDPHATHLLQRVLDFTIHMLPPNFYLDASAPQLYTCPRLPAIPQGHESRPSRADPRLTQIRFGEVPVDDHQRPSFATTTISSVLLSLPFVLLKCVLEHPTLVARLGPDTVASIMRQVVAEREVRRTKALKARAAVGDVNGKADSEQATLAQNLYWREGVENSTQHRAGLRLVRRRVDLDTPSSPGACSERIK